MTKRTLLTVLLLVAFLLSAWGNVIGAAFCPRYLVQNCFAHKTRRAEQAAAESCHHEMADMEMRDRQMDGDSTEPEVTDVSVNPTIIIEAESSSVEQTALDRPTEPCGHCWMHSQPSSGSGTLAAVNLSPRPVQALAPSAGISIDLGFPNLTTIEPSEHSPPGKSLPRHILVNVFLI